MSGISPEEWVDLQRDCHPFPIYADYIHSKDTASVLEQQQLQSPVAGDSQLDQQEEPDRYWIPSFPQDLTPSASLAALAQGKAISESQSDHTLFGDPAPASTNPAAMSSDQPSSARAQGSRRQNRNEMSSANQFLRDFAALRQRLASKNATPAVQPPAPSSPTPVVQSSASVNRTPAVQPSIHVPFDPVTSPPSQSMLNIYPTGPSVATRAPTAIHLLRADELLQSQYDFVPHFTRLDLNEKIKTMWSVLTDSSRPHKEIKETRNRLINLSNRISQKLAAEMKMGAAKDNFHKELPEVWNALKMRQNLPVDHDGHKAAGAYLISIIDNMGLGLHVYAHNLIQDMTIAESQGRDALELIPGFSTSKGKGKGKGKRTAEGQMSGSEGKKPIKEMSKAEGKKPMR